MKRMPFILVWFLASAAAWSQVPVVNTLSNLLALPVAPGNRTQRAVDVLGVTGPYDGVPTMRWVWDGTNTTSTNSAFLGQIVRASTFLTNGAPGRWLHAWKGDPRVFGVKFLGSTTNDAAANQAAMEAAVAAAKLTGVMLKAPAGTTHVYGGFDGASLAGLMGESGPNASIETEFVICQKGSGLFTGVTTGAKFSNFRISPLYLSWFRDDTTSVGIKTASLQYDIDVENVEFKTYRGLELNAWDCHVNNFSFYGVQGISTPGFGTQNHFGRVVMRGIVEACSTNSNTAITIASYTAGETNITVSDGQPLRVGDIVMIGFFTSAGYTSALPAKNWGRRITAVSGNTITISNPWPTSFTSGRLYYLLGQGTSAISATSGQHFSTLNVEYGAWQTVFSGAAVGTHKFGSVHVEGVTIYEPGAHSLLFSCDFANLNIEQLQVVNTTILDVSSFSIFDRWANINCGTLLLRDFDQFQTTKTIYISRARDTKRMPPVSLQHLSNWGVPVADPVTQSYELSGATYRGGEGMFPQQRVGTRNMHFYSFSTVPTFGSFVAGDRIFLPTNTLTVRVSGTLGTPAGNYKIRSGSKVLVTDSDARNVIGQRTVVKIGSAPYIVDRVALGGVVSMTLASNAAAGDRDVWVTTASGTIGDCGIIGFGDATYEDVVYQRMVTSTTPDRLHLSLPLANSYTAGTTIESGACLSSASSTNVTSLTALEYYTPEFTGPIQPTSDGSFSATGVTTLGSPSQFTTLVVKGNASGARAIHVDRDGVNKIGFGVGDSGFVIHQEDPYPIYPLLSGSSDSSAVSLNVGGANQAAFENGRRADILAPSANSASTNADLVGGSIRLLAGVGTGSNAVLASVDMLVPTNKPTGTTVQERQLGLRVRHPGRMLNATHTNTMIQFPYWDGSTYQVLRLVVTNDAGILKLVCVVEP